MNMNSWIKDFAPVLILALIVFALNTYFGAMIGIRIERGRMERSEVVGTDTVVVVDTVMVAMPVARDSAVVRYVEKFVPLVRLDTAVVRGGVPMVKDSTAVDSVLVRLDISQIYYKGAEYEAWVSGHEARMDSIRVFPTTTTIVREKTKPPDRWQIGITGGVGYGIVSRRVEPFVGVGITYRLFSF